MGKFIGGRIVPMHCGVWDETVEYEVLSIVLEEGTGDSYISRRAVPAGTGLQQSDYWAMCSRFSEQMKLLEDGVAASVEVMQKNVEDTKSAMSEELTETENRVTEQVNAAERSMQETEAAMNEAVEQMSARLDANVSASTDADADYAAEVVDARVDELGNTHANLGTAIRNISARVDAKLSELMTISENLFDISTVKDGKYYLDTGKLGSYSVCQYSEEYIPVLPNTAYAWTNRQNLIICTYTQDKEFIERIITYSANSYTTITMGADVAFVRLCIYEMLFSDTFMFVQGTSVPEQFIPHRYIAAEMLENGGITEVKLAEKSVTESKLADNSVTEDKLKNSSVTAMKIADKSISVDKLADVEDLVYESELIDDSELVITGGHYYNQSGALVASSYYDAIDYACERDEVVTISKMQRVSLFSGIPSKDTFLEIIFTDNNCKTTMEIEVEAGQHLGMNHHKNYNYEIRRRGAIKGYSLAGLLLPDTTPDKVTVVYNGKDTISVYVPTHTDFIRWDMRHMLNEKTNADNWRISSTYHATLAKNGVQITTAGEHEMALKMVGRDDFIGGGNHGDEMLTSFCVYGDGLRIEPDMLTAQTEMDEIKFVQCSDLYDPSDHQTIVAVHYKEYVFDRTGLLLKQRIVWNGTYELTYSYITMLPIQRKDSTSGEQITDTVYDDLNYKEYDVGESGFTTYPHKQKVGAKKYTIYSEKSGVSATVELLNITPEIPGAMSFVQNTDAYNKVYFDMCGSSYTTSENEVWEIHSKFKIDCKK